MAIVIDEILGEFLGAALEDKFGADMPEEQKLIEDPEMKVLFAGTAGPGLAVAMERIISAIKEGRFDDTFFKQTLRNFGVEDKASALAKFSRFAAADEKAAQEMVEMVADPKMKGEDFLKASKKKAGTATRFKKMAQQLGSEVDEVIPERKLLTETAGLPPIPTDAEYDKAIASKKKLPTEKVTTMAKELDVGGIDTKVRGKDVKRIGKDIAKSKWGRIAALLGIIGGGLGLRQASLPTKEELEVSEVIEPKKEYKPVLIEPSMDEPKKSRREKTVKALDQLIEELREEFKR